MPQVSPPHTITHPAFPLIPTPSLSLFVLFVTLSVWPTVTLAEVRVVTAQGEYRMGDRDTREDAIRLATETAKRNALEQVAVYLESITIVDGLDVTKDEIRTYTAGLVLVLEQETNTTLDGDTIVVRTDLVAQIDTEEVRQAIAALRENEDARHQLVALQQENDQLQQDLDAANQALAQASTTEQTQLAAQQRQDILNRVQSNAMVSQAWTDWVLVSPAVYSSQSGGVSPDPSSPERRTRLIPHKSACPSGTTSDYHKTAADTATTARSPCTGNETSDHATPSDHAGAGITDCSANVERNHVPHTNGTTAHRQSTRRHESDAALDRIENVDRRPPVESLLAVTELGATHIATGSDSRVTVSPRTSAFFTAPASSGRRSPDWTKTFSSDDESDPSAGLTSSTTCAPSDCARRGW